MQRILHIDGDSFFVACEQAMNPYLRNKPVITGRERSIATAMSIEAKRAGITRGMTAWQAKKICPNLIVVSGNYLAYAIFSQRMNSILERYSNCVEAYSIDESFALIDDSIDAHAIKDALEIELGLSFSIGIGQSKTLAKLGSNYNKPSGCVIIDEHNREEVLHNTPVQKVWGIGRKSAAKLIRHGITTAYEFTQQSQEWVRNTLHKPGVEIFHELRGQSVYPLHDKISPQKSISSTRTFYETSGDREYIWSRLSQNIENVCAKARKQNLLAGTATFQLKTQDFTYHTHTIKFSSLVNTPATVLYAIRPLFEKAYRKNTMYRATGITLSNLAPQPTQQSLFDDSEKEKREDQRELFKSIDTLNNRYGKGTIHLGSSPLDSKNRSSQSTHEPTHPSIHKTIGIPWLGLVR